KLMYFTKSTLLPLTIRQYTIIYGLNITSDRKINRNLKIDLEKALKIKINEKYILFDVQLCEQCKIKQFSIGNLTLYNEQAFFKSAEWLLTTQNDITGCWYMTIVRQFAQDYKLNPNWCSSMSQGLAASLFIRMFSLTNEKKWLNGALQVSIRSKKCF
ncbi:unnamed protein product, partial [Didymodactylos carnosus]